MSDLHIILEYCNMMQHKSLWHVRSEAAIESWAVGHWKKYCCTRLSGYRRILDW
jgi:hypothetical protein